MKTEREPETERGQIVIIGSDIENHWWKNLPPTERQTDGLLGVDGRTVFSTVYYSTRTRIYCQKGFDAPQVESSQMSSMTMVYVLN